jgi:putative ABC transport system permease protein
LDLVSLSERYLFHNKKRLFLRVALVSFAMFLIIGTTGVYYGEVKESTLYIDKSNADLWVVARGNLNLYATFSTLPLTIQANISSIPGVQQIGPVVYGTGLLQNGRNNQSIFFVGYDPTSGLGGPCNEIQGARPTAGDQIVIDNSLANQLGVREGDYVKLNGQEFQTVGTFDGPCGFSSPYVFVDMDGIARIGIPNIADAFLVQLAPGSSANQTSSLISRTAGLGVFTNSAWSQASASIILEGSLPVLTIVLAFGFIMAIVTILVSGFESTDRRKKEYGTLKAIGMPHRDLYRTVLVQAVVVTAISLPVGGALVLFILKVVTTVLRYTLVFTIDLDQLAIIVLLALGFGLVGALIPAARIARIDPASAFTGE